MKKLENKNIIRIDKIYVKNLFNLYNYKLDFRKENNISVLISPNGYGKTTILNFIDFIVNPCYDSFLKIIKVPFSSVECLLSNNFVVKLSKKANKNSNSKARIYQLYGENLNKFEFTIGRIQDDGSFDYNLKSISLLIDKTFIGRGREIDSLYYDTEDQQFNFSNAHEYRLSQMFLGRIEDFYSEKFGEIINMYTENSITMPQICYIKSNRIRQSANAERIERHRPTGFSTSVFEKFLFNKSESTLNDIEKKMNALIQTKYLEYVNAFNSKLIEMSTEYLKSSNNNLCENDDDIIKNYKQLIEHVEKYTDIGLLKTKLIDLGDIEQYLKANKDKKTYLQMFMNNVKTTLKPIEEIYHKFKLFVDIFNSRNKDSLKVMSIEDGLCIKVNGNVLEDINSLSSGEKNDFIMFYNLIFESEEGGIVLIDEPEISLHIEWQEEYLDKLFEINKLNNAQIIIVTHSPYIVNDHCDMFVKREME